MKNTLSVKVEDESGTLTRIAGLFARRGFNIESLAVGPAEEIGISRITMVINGDKQTIEQLIKQLYKLVSVLEINNLTNVPSVERELVLIKIQALPQNRTDILNLAEIFRAKIVDVAFNSLILEISGDPGKIAAFEKSLSKYGTLEIAKTGKIALSRESKISSEFIKNTY